VVERHLHLLDPEAPPQQVDREPDLDTEATRQRQGGPESVAGQAALTRQRLGGSPAGGPLDA
jgi:hypothetical protein